MRCRIAFLLFFITVCAKLPAQTPIVEPDLSTATLISPYYFGPNACPVPEMLDGRNEKDLRIELAPEYSRGSDRSNTYTFNFKVQVPLFTERVTLSAWIPLEKYSTPDRKGCAVGDAFVSTDIHILKEKNWRPDISMRAAMKTASSKDYHLKRYYDAPGYFFDAFVGKSFAFDHSSMENRLRVSVSTGFLCWQTGIGRQNDAVQYGVQLKWENRWFDLSQTLAGYSGWEHTAGNLGNEAHDCPMVLKTNLTARLSSNWDFIAAYTYGLKDFPFHQFRLGAALRVDILKRGGKP